MSAASFTADTASKTGLNERTIRRSIHRVERIAPGVRDAIRDMPEIADKGVELDALAKMSPERQAAVVAIVAGGDAPSIRTAVAFTPRTDEAEAAVKKEPKPTPPSTVPPPGPTAAQKWARCLADLMSVPELRDLRDELDRVLAAADQSGSAAGH